MAWSAADLAGRDVRGATTSWMAPVPLAEASLYELRLPGMCTIHANSAREAVTKMCTLGGASLTEDISSHNA